MGTFIQIDIDDSQFTPEVASSVVSLCPVDIFVLDGTRLAVRSEQEDECTLCELCLDGAPVGALSIRKVYKDEQLISRGHRK
jgi:NAD-dependent dihydropyrimidine dehydrogenase PreA subunit